MHVETRPLNEKHQTTQHNSNSRGDMHTIDDITSLDAVRWERARKAAEQLVRDKAPRPDKAVYTAPSFDRFPRWVTLSMLLVLLVIGTAAFWMSAGKQIAATDVALQPIVLAYSNRLSSTWSDAPIVSPLLLVELDTILF